MAGIDYRYELWSGEEVVATGRLNYQQPLEVGDGIEIGGRHGIVSTIEPVLREHELRLVVEQLRDPSQPVSQSVSQALLVGDRRSTCDLCATLRPPDARIA